VTAAIITLAVTIGSWVLDFTLAGQTGWLEWLYRLSLTQTLRPFEQGLFSLGLVLGILAVVAGLIALAAIWLRPGLAIAGKLTRSFGCLVAAGLMLILATQVKIEIDATEDRRNSFSAADQRALRDLREPLVITVHLVPEDPRYVDLRRNVLSKLERVLPNVRVHLATSGQSVIGSANEKSYGEVEYVYAGRRDASRSTSHREILPLLYGLAKIPPPEPITADDYPGYPLVANANAALPWFFGLLPILIVLAWWWSSRPPRVRLHPIKNGGTP
jgi:ABC-2 type transport system permease protein